MLVPFLTIFLKQYYHRSREEMWSKKSWLIWNNNAARVFGHGQPFITVNSFQFLPLFSSFPLGWNQSYHFADVLQLPLTTFDERSYSCVLSPLFATEVYCPPGILLGQYFFGVRWLVYRLHLGQLTIVHGRQARSFQCRLEGWSGGRRPSNIDSTPTTSSASDETSVIIITTAAVDVINIINMAMNPKTWRVKSCP